MGLISRYLLCLHVLSLFAVSQCQNHCRHVSPCLVDDDLIAGERDKSPEREIEATPPAPLTSSPVSPPTVVDVDPIAQRLAVLQKRLDIEMKVSELPLSYI